jgi:hypothetical protein
MYVKELSQGSYMIIFCKKEADSLQTNELLSYIKVILGLIDTTCTVVWKLWIIPSKIISKSKLSRIFQEGLEILGKVTKETVYSYVGYRKYCHRTQTK